MNKQLITNIIGTHEFFWRSMAIEVYDKNGLFAWVTNIDNKYLNGVTSTNVNITISDIQNIIEFFKVRNLPWLWNLNPISNPEVIKELLISQGLKYSGSGAVMYYNLTHELPEFKSNDYNIIEILNDNDLNDWSYLQEQGFGPSEKFYQATKKIPYGGSNQFHHYVVYLDKKPVSCATLSISNYGARIDNVTTSNNFLRRGLGRAVTLFAMNEAKKFGCKMVCLESSNEGVPLYLNIGFREIYQNKEYGVST